MQRESYFDNAKFILIVLVVFGHIIRSYIEQNEGMLAIYKFIYTFHMPAFILIAGYFAKGYQQKGYIQKVASKLIIPYLIFHGIYSIYYVLIKNENVWIVANPLNPHWSLWFLLSLFFWNILLYLFALFRKEVAMGVSFIIALSVGYIEEVNHFMSLSRTFVFFPLFLIGSYMKRKHFLLLKHKSARISSFFLLIGIAILYSQISFDYEWLFGSKPYAHFGDVTIISCLKRLLFYVLTLVTTFSFLSLVPSKKLFFTDWGTRTFYVYLLHGFFIQAFRISDMERNVDALNNILIAGLCALMLTIVLSSRWIRNITKPFIEIKLPKSQKSVTVTRRI